MKPLLDGSKALRKQAVAVQEFEMRQAQRYIKYLRDRVEGYEARDDMRQDLFLTPPPEMHTEGHGEVSAVDPRRT